MITDCYLCGKPITSNQAVTGDHVIPTVLLGKKQPKIRGYDYAGRIPTHQACNNHFSDETFYRQAIHLVELFQAGKISEAVQNKENPAITILPVTTDQVSSFVGRDFKRFNFIDTREIDISELKTPNFYDDKSKTNLLKVAMYAAMTVMAKSAAALLVKRKLKSVPKIWNIFASPFDVSRSPVLLPMLASSDPFDKNTRASLHQIRQDEWLVIYQHKNLLVFFIFVIHDNKIDISRIFSGADCEFHTYCGNSINDLLIAQWNAV